MTRHPLRLLAALGLALAAAAPAAASGKVAYEHYLKALLYKNQGQYAEAMREYDAALALDPEGSTMYQQAAQLAMEMNDNEKALKLASRYAELAPESAEAQFLLGQVYWARGEGEPARAAFEKALQLKPGYSEALFALGNLLTALSPDEALKYLERYVAENPDDASEALYQIAVLESRAGHDEAAETRLKASIAADADNMQARNALAQLYEARHDTEAALGAYQAILERDPRNVVLINHVGEIYVLKDQNDKALEYFRRAKEIAPSHPGTCLWMALMAEEAGDFAQAAKEVRESAALPEDAALNLRLSYYLTQAGQLADAVAVLEKAAERWPDNDEVLYFLGLGYDDLKQTAKAAAAMEKVLKLKPEHRDALFQLGALREKQGDMPGAEAAFQRLLKDHPNDAAALNYLGYSLADRGLKLDEAEGYVKKALSLEPDNGAYLDSSGWVEHKRGHDAQALETLKRAADVLPGDDTVWAHLSEVQAAMGDKAGAWDSLKRAQAAAPDNASLTKRADTLEDGVSAAELAARTLALQRALRGRLSSFGGPCELAGSIGSKSFQFNALLQYRAPEQLGLDVLGPLFVPLFRAELGTGDAFTMDPLALEGVPPDRARDVVYGALRLVRAWLDGSLYAAAPGELKRGWRKPPRVETAAAVLTLDKSGVLVESARPAEGGLELDLSDYRPISGRVVPSVLRVQGRGFSLEFRFARPDVRFE